MGSPTSEDARVTLMARASCVPTVRWDADETDGVLTAEMLGSGSEVEGKLEKLLKRACESSRESAEILDSKATSAGTR